MGGINPRWFFGVASGSLFGDGTYSGNIIQDGSVLTPTAGVVTVTGAATVAPDGTTGASVVMCDTLVLDGASASLKPSTNSKGLIVFAKTKIELKNGAKLNIDRLGKAGDFGNLTAYALTPASLQGKLAKAAVEAYVVLGEGAAGASPTTGNHDGLPGSAATAMQTGGGGSGGASSVGVVSGAGGKGGPCCGGAGGGAQNGGSSESTDGGAYGGAGGNAYTTGGYLMGGGAGDPVGSGMNGGTPAPGAGGGLLCLFTPALSIASGCIVSADGSPAGAGNAVGDGSAGGGIVLAVTLTGGLANAGTIRASGGAATAGTYQAGGAGGAGSVNTFEI